jgi:hypothetical protein
MSTSTQTLTGPALLERARAFVARKHHGQKGKRPAETYLDHLEAVVRLLKKHGEERQPTFMIARKKPIWMWPSSSASSVPSRCSSSN